MRFNGADKVELPTISLKINITGKNLDDLVDYLVEHRLMWIKEPDSDGDVIKVKKGEVTIKTIEIEEGRR